MSIAFLVLLETLSPTERAALLLREAFEFEYDEIARTLEKSEANCRQLVKRARDRIAGRRPRFLASRDARDRIVSEFMDAVATGNVENLLGMLTDDATLVSDGGGKVVAALNPIVGADRIARFLAGIAKKAPSDLATRLTTVNGDVGFVVESPDRTNVIAFEVSPNGIRGIYIVATRRSSSISAAAAARSQDRK